MDRPWSSCSSHRPFHGRHVCADFTNLACVFEFKFSRLRILTKIVGGTVKVSSTDPFAKPLIDPKYLSTEFDIFTTVASVKAAKRFAGANAFKGFVTGPYGDLATANTDAEIEAYVRKTAETVFHPTGTAMMSPKGAHWGVVDPDLKVKGVQGLRIVDASIYVSHHSSLVSCN